MSSDDNLTCFTSYDNDWFAAVVGVRSAVAILSILCCIVVILLIVLFQKYNFFTQRLILYFTIATLSYSIVSAINVEGYKAYRDSTINGYCVFIGFLEQFTSWWFLLAVTCIVVDLFIKVIFNKMTDLRFEIAYIIITFVSPILIAWIPFVDVAYGPSGAWCWIRSTNSDCSFYLFGTILRFLLFYCPLYILLFVQLVLLVIVFIKLRRQHRSWAGKFDPDTLEMKRRMQKEVRPLITYPIVFLLANVFPLMNRIANVIQDEPILPLWFLVAIVFSIQGVIVMFAFALDPETRKKLTWRHIVAAFKNLVSRQGRIEEYDIHQDNLTEPEIENVVKDNDDSVSS